MLSSFLHNSWSSYDMETHSPLLALYEGTPSVTVKEAVMRPYIYLFIDLFIYYLNLFIHLSIYLFIRCKPN